MYDTFLGIMNRVLRTRKKQMREKFNSSESFEAFIHERRVHERMENPPRYLVKGFNLQKYDINGCSMYYFTNKAVQTDKTIFYLHGGAYTVGPFGVQWKSISDIAKMADMNWVLFDYPKYPEGTAITTTELTVQAYEQVLRNTNEIYILGDSAGGNLSLLLHNQLQNKKSTLPKKMVLLSPWVDVSMSNQDLLSYQSTDAMLDINNLIISGKGFAGELDTKNPLVSPFYHEYESLVATRIYISDEELLYPDCKKFYERLKKQQFNITLYTEHKMPHDWITFPVLKEGLKGRRQVAEWLKEEDTNARKNNSKNRL